MIKVEKIRRNFDNLDTGLKVFLTLVLGADENGAVRTNQSELSKYLSISRQTVGKHIKTFVDCNMLKYKYSGDTLFNPEFYFNGVTDLNSAIEKYKEFESDM